MSDQEEPKKKVGKHVSTEKIVDRSSPLDESVTGNQQRSRDILKMQAPDEWPDPPEKDKGRNNEKAEE